MAEPGRLLRIITGWLLTLTAIATIAYAGLSIYITTQLVYVPPTPLYATPASMGVAYHNVTFPSRVDKLQLRGWFIPGILPNGKLTTQRTIIFIHGNRTNRADKLTGLLKLS